MGVMAHLSNELYNSSFMSAHSRISKFIIVIFLALMLVLHHNRQYKCEMNSIIGYLLLYRP